MNKEDLEHLSNEQKEALNHFAMTNRKGRRKWLAQYEKEQQLLKKKENLYEVQEKTCNY